MYQTQAQQGYGRSYGGSSDLSSFLTERSPSGMRSSHPMLESFSRSMGDSYSKPSPAIDFSKMYAPAGRAVSSEKYLANQVMGSKNSTSTTALSEDPQYQRGDLEKYLGSTSEYGGNAPTYNINITINYNFGAGNAGMGGYSKPSTNYDNAVLQDSILETIKNTYLSNNSKMEFVPDSFLNTNRPTTEFIGNVDDVKPFIEQAFKAVTGEDLPANLSIHVLDEENFLKAHGMHGGSYSEGIMGFSLNSQGTGLNQVFVKQDNLDRMMLTMGHEIGHVMSKSLPNQQDEEAKAFAFSLAWMEKIIEKNIGGLSACIHPRPAENGLHNVAFDFVGKILKQGSTAFELFKELVKGNVSIITGGY
ncbi:hypothetical protein HZA97_01415 [Candidatus Woesearchaeota archaeon]|nr:hypothetical protein [Candidatus Woesearchaeota archaeon]